ncbi:carbon-nitrogen hydrolase family protein [Paracoccus caeni]|uniref:Carbon-nitrogen hydrolase family protein n=1 Tax=Paracoccus caeni TaxID=657651 RepID=A0A934SEH4_9RHOB|nr:carbon-nitrogen hydrolase family protein [Paracoccus caeni]MBK4215890.1 carbon-nitrogen hydrolase family protein [Paracoccus caeni]
MRLALAQMSPGDAADGTALAQLETLAASLSLQNVDLLILPELFLPGYNQPSAHRDLSQPLDGEWSRSIAAIARNNGLAIAYGWAERDGNAVYNAASFIGPDGARLAHYRKIQLFGEMERASFTPGHDAPPVFAFKDRQLGMLICYDIEFPEHARDLAGRGAQVLLVPTANPQGFEHVQDILVPARAYENRVTVAYANYSGPDGDLVFGGGSVIAGPDGKPLASAGTATGQTVLIVDLPADDGSDLLSTQLGDLRRPY